MNNNKIKVLSTGLIYRNPQAHIKSIHAYFPSVVTMDNGEMLSTIVLGQAFESHDRKMHVCRSTDEGESWTLEQELPSEKPGRVTSNTGRLTYLGGGKLVAYMMRADQTDYPEFGLTNPETLGFVPTEPLLLRSNDYGYTWSQPEPVNPPLVGPAFEICSPITILSDGRWVISTETWPGWDGECPNGIRMIGLVSHDEGNSWPEYMDIMNEEGKNVYFWESKIIELKDGRLLAIAWVYDDDVKKDRPNHYVTSSDGGKTWSLPKSMGLIGQTLTPYMLDDGRLLCVYRRMDTPGLWAAICRLDKNEWVVESQTPLWGNNTQGLTSSGENMSQNFTSLRFGAPCITKTPSGDLFVAFWCYEDCISVLRYFKLAVQ